MWSVILSYISSSIPLSVPLMYGSTGEIITEKSGHLNLGIPGIMYVGAISSVIGSFLYETGCANAGVALNPVLAVLIPLLSCILGAVLMGLIYSFLTVTLRVNQNVTGLALTTFGVGLGNFFGGSLIKLVDSDMPSVALTKYSKTPLAANADMVLYIATPEISMRSGAMSSRLAQLMVIDAIFTAVAHMDYESVTVNLEKSHDITKAHRVSGNTYRFD